MTKQEWECPWTLSHNARILKHPSDSLLWIIMGQSWGFGVCLDKQILCDDEYVCRL